MRPSYASLCSVSNVFFFGKRDFPTVFWPSSTCQWFRLLTVCCQRFTNQPIVFCVMRPTLNSLALAKRAVSLFSSRAAALVSRVSRLRRSRARALLSLNLKKKRDCSQSKQRRDNSTTLESDVFRRCNLLYLCCVDLFTIVVLLCQIYLKLNQ